MRSLREWLIKHEWFLIEVDPNPEYWHIHALSPAGQLWAFTGTSEVVDSWDRVDRLVI